MTPLSWLIAAGIAFLVGSFPTGFLIARARGIDIRKVGSGNIGATNVGRVLGRRAWLLCFTGDFLKGFVPVIGAGVFAGLAGRWSIPSAQGLWWCLVIAAAMAGHMFCPWLGFKGGKGVATGLGSILGLFPLLTTAGLCGLGVFLLVLWRWRYVSLAAISAAVSLPAFVLLQAALIERWGLAPGSVADSLPLAGVMAMIAGVVLWKHRTNVQRILQGTEPKVGTKKPAAAA